MPGFAGSQLFFYEFSYPIPLDAIGPSAASVSPNVSTVLRLSPPSPFAAPPI